MARTYPGSQLPCAIRELVRRARYQCAMRILVTGGSGFMASALARARASLSRAEAAKADADGLREVTARLATLSP